MAEEDIFTIDGIKYELYPTKLVISNEYIPPIEIIYESLEEYDNYFNFNNSPNNTATHVYEYEFPRFSLIILHKPEETPDIQYTLILHNKDENGNRLESYIREQIPEEMFNAIYLKLSQVIDTNNNINNNNINNIINNTNTNTNNNVGIANYPNNGERNNRNIFPINAISMNHIQNGNNMVNFHDEFAHQRYYRKNTFNQLQHNINSGKKKNPFTQQTIEPENIKRYRAKKAAAQGGRRRKTLKRRRVNKKKKTQRRR